MYDYIYKNALAKKMGISRTTLDKTLKDNPEIKGVKVGKLTKYSYEEVVNYLRESQNDATI